MPNNSLNAAIKEAYASAKKNDPVLETIEISHPDLATTFYLVRNNEDVALTLEDASTKTFEAVGFQFRLPSSGDNGLQELSLQIDNVDRRVSKFIDDALAYDSPITVKYRIYLASDKTAPQNDPPLSLTLVDVSITAFQVVARAKFANVLNKRFPRALYTRRRFPSLAG